MPRTPEQVRESKRLHMEKRRIENPEKVRAYARQHHQKNREKSCKTMRDYYARRFFWGRAMKLKGPQRANATELSSMWKKQRGKCALTGRRLNKSAQLDHILSKVRGGKDSKENLRWLCKEANLARRELNDDEFITLCQDVISNQKKVKNA
jgi:hypothetical protein